MNWNWNPHKWKPSARLLLGIATVWPIVYMALFFVLAISGMWFGLMMGDQSHQHSSRLDLIQLEKKVQGGEIKELRITSEEIRAYDRNGREFYTSVDNESTREEIIRQARTTGPEGSPRVAKIDENTSRAQVDNPLFPVGMLLFFGFHMLTMMLMLLLMPVYIILPLKNERLDQNMRIVWVILACTVGALSDVVYWYVHIWRKPPVNPPLAPDFT